MPDAPLRKPNKTRARRRRYARKGISYDVAEIAKLFNVHRNTVRQWLREGLETIDDRRRLLIHGAALKSYLTVRQRARKHVCDLGEFFCFKMGQDGDKSFCVAGVEPVHWADASPVRAIYKEAFGRAGLPYFPPHSFRHTLGRLMQTMCRRPEQIRAWSQNLGHQNIATTLTSYGRIDAHRQGAVIGAISQGAAPDSELLARIRALVG